MSLAVAEKVRGFVRGGVIVLGPAPVASCTLEDHDPVRRKLASIVQQLWQPHLTATEAIVHSTACLSQCLQEAHIQPDVLFENLRDRTSGEPIVLNPAETQAVNPTLDGYNRKGWGVEFQHRRDGEREIYYFSNQEVIGVATDVSFRASGMKPYLWHPETGGVHEVVVYREHEGRIVPPMRFDPAEAVFIVFEPHRSSLPVATAVSGKQELELRRSLNSLIARTFASGAWQITLNTGPVENVSAQVPPPLPITQPWKVTFRYRNSEKSPRVISLKPGSWTLHEDSDIRYFSGTVTYELQFVLPSSLQQPDLQLWLDLGDVANLAHIRVNGKYLGVAWKPPYMLDVNQRRCLRRKSHRNRGDEYVDQPPDRRRDRTGGVPDAGLRQDDVRYAFERFQPTLALACWAPSASEVAERSNCPRAQKRNSVECDFGRA